MSQYFLSKTAHVCVSGAHVVFLELASGQYFGLPIVRARGLGQRIAEWPLDSWADEPCDDELLRRLIERGLLTDQQTDGKPASPVSLHLSTQWLGDTRPAQPPAIRWLHVWRFVNAVLFAQLALRCCRLDTLVKRASRRKRSSAAPSSADDLISLMTIYGRLRPWLYARHDNCLMHCLALLEFLTHYDIHPDWVFGVRAAPFQAHSWLQHAGRSLTDSPLKLDRFTPIMVV
jgi:hypothetical protein